MPKKKNKILIVDDSRYHRFQLKKMLLENDFKVFEAEDGIDGIQLFRKVSRGECEPHELKDELSRWGLFEEYEDRFFALFGKGR